MKQGGTQREIADAWRNAAWLIGERGIRMIVAFAVGILVSRYLGPARYGLLNAAVATAALCAAVVDLGLDTVLRRELIARPADHGRLLGSAGILRMLALAPALALFATLFFIADDEFRILAPACVILLFTPFPQLLDSWFQSQTQARYCVWAQTSALVFGTASRLTLVAVGAGTMAFAWSQSAEVLAGSITLWALYSRFGVPFRSWKVNQADLRLLWNASWPFALINFSALFYSRIDTVLLQLINGAETAGYYTASLRLTELNHIIPLILVNSFFPLLGRLHAADPEAFERKFQWMASLVAGLTISGALVLSFAAPWLVPLVLGEEYRPAAQLLPISAWGTVFACLGAVRGQWVLLKDRQIYALGYVAIGAALNLTLNLWLIPAHGAIGAAIAGVLTQLAVALIIPSFFAPVRPSVRYLLAALSLRGLFSRT